MTFLRGKTQHRLRAQNEKHGQDVLVRPHVLADDQTAHQNRHGERPSPQRHPCGNPPGHADLHLNHRPQSAHAEAQQRSGGVRHPHERSGVKLQRGKNDRKASGGLPQRYQTVHFPWRIREGQAHLERDKEGEGHKGDVRLRVDRPPGEGQAERCDDAAECHDFQKAVMPRNALPKRVNEGKGRPTPGTASRRTATPANPKADEGTRPPDRCLPSQTIRGGHGPSSFRARRWWRWSPQRRWC